MAVRHLGILQQWSAEDDARLCELAGNATIVRGSSSDAWREIASHFINRSPDACKQRVYTLRNRAAGKPEKSHQRRTRAETVAAVCLQPPIPPSPKFVPFHIAVATILGDPLPGRSALDRKREGA